MSDPIVAIPATVWNGEEETNARWVIAELTGDEESPNELHIQVRDPGDSGKLDVSIYVDYRDVLLRIAQLLEHRARDHVQDQDVEAPTSVPDADGDLKCPKCGRFFVRAQALGKHAKTCRGASP